MLMFAFILVIIAFVSILINYKVKIWKLNSILEFKNYYIKDLQKRLTKVKDNN